MSDVNQIPETQAAPPPAVGKERRARSLNAGALAERFGLPVLLVLMVIVFSIQLPDTFATTANWRAIAVSQSVLAVAAMALMLPLVTGRFDISVGANIGITSIVTAAAMSTTTCRWSSRSSSR